MVYACAARLRLRILWADTAPGQGCEACSRAGTPGGGGCHRTHSGGGRGLRLLHRRRLALGEGLRLAGRSGQAATLTVRSTAAQVLILKQSACLPSVAFCRRLCQALADSGPLEHQLLYRQQLEELEPLIRFCQYEQGRSGAAPADAAPEQGFTELLQVRAAYALIAGLVLLTWAARPTYVCCAGPPTGTEGAVQ